MQRAQGCRRRVEQSGILRAGPVGEVESVPGKCCDAAVFGRSREPGHLQGCRTRRPPIFTGWLGDVDPRQAPVGIRKWLELLRLQLQVLRERLFGSARTRRDLLQLSLALIRLLSLVVDQVRPPGGLRHRLGCAHGDEFEYIGDRWIGHGSPLGFGGTDRPWSAALALRAAREPQAIEYRLLHRRCIYHFNSNYSESTWTVKI